ncbi:ribosome maturation factor RimM [Allocoleopsis sp.]|uniref:ribosome maturation factor RimM n=1 Tax=Allocoleopsis sp. TaxID=3088169 RepID=UPI002FD2E1ED
MDNEDWLEIGKIVAPQGLKGELRVYPNSDFPERFEEPGQRFLKRPGETEPQPVELLGGRYVPGKGLYVVRLAGVENCDQAEALRDSVLFVPASDRPELGEDEYHVIDLLDLEVFNQVTGELLGVVVDVIPAGNSLLEVKLHKQPEAAPAKPEAALPTRTSKIRKAKRPKEKKPVTVLIPFVKAIAPVVDLQRGRIEITPPPGLLEINDDITD